MAKDYVKITDTPLTYHYSPTTGKPEVCRSTQGKCPFSNYLHTNNIEELLKYSDLENSRFDLKFPEIVEFTRNDWSKSNHLNGDYFLTTSPTYNKKTRSASPKLDKDSLIYLGLSAEEANHFTKNFEEVTVMPLKDTSYIKYLNNFSAYNHVFDKLDTYYKEERYGSLLGQPYQKYGFINAVNMSDYGSSMLTRVYAVGPYNEDNYSLQDCWDTYVEQSKKDGSAKIISKSGKDFLVLGTPEVVSYKETMKLAQENLETEGMW